MAGTGENKSQSAKQDSISVAGRQGGPKPLSRSFPGPAEARARLRVAIDKAAYAELIAHAKGSLDAEICGALAGNVCEDERGLFVFVSAILPGLAASRGSTHVTFTQETWNQIHQSLERNYPKLQMVGWYHSHPGFGVEFSEMDLFIQRNFFGGPTQIAVVFDPMGGAVAICVNTDNDIEYLDKFWVEGREQTCQTPRKIPAPGAAAAGGAVDHETLRGMDARLSQLIQALDDQRASYYRFLTFCGIVICLGVIACFGYTYYSAYRYRLEPPKLNQVIPVGIKIGDQTVMLGVGVAEWHVPDELNASLIELEREKQLEAEKEKLEGTNLSPAESTNLAKPKP